MNIKNLILGLTLSMFVLSCNEDETNSSTELSEAEVNAKIDVITEDVSDIIEGQFNQQVNNVAGRSEDNSEPELPSCATVTVSFTETSWTRTVVFDNCELPNGNVVDGTIIVRGSLNFDSPSHTISYTFENFRHNNRLIEGNRTVIRTFQSTSTLIQPHPVAKMYIDMTVTFPNGNVYTRVGYRIREMIEGFNTPFIRMDNVFSITGSWTTTFQTETRTSTITTPLIVRANCPNIVSGVVTTERDNYRAVLDYGNGDCDNQATLTVNGTTTTITLGN
jgi:hypothetical protein